MRDEAPANVRFKNVGVREALRGAGRLTVESLRSPIRAVENLFQGKHPKDALKGPSGILSVGSYYAGQGVFNSIVAYMIVITSIVSIVNLCPLPPFDGGEFVLAIYKGVTGQDLAKGI